MMKNEKQIVDKTNEYLQNIGLSLSELIEVMGRNDMRVFELNDRSYEKFVKAYEKIKENNYEENEKGKLLEELTYILFHQGYSNLIECRKNCRTSTNEIDLQLNWKQEAKIAGIQNVFSFLGDSFLCECKNYQKKVGVTYIGKFFSLLSVTNTNLGIMITWDGITGKTSWSDSKGLIKKIALKDNTYILTIDQYDLEKIYKRETNIFSILNNKYIALKNEIDYSKYVDKHEAEEQMKEHSD